MIGMLITPSRTSSLRCGERFYCNLRSKKAQGNASPTQQRNLRPNLSKHSTMSLCRRVLFLLTTNLVVPKKGTPGATAEHEGLHERSFGLDGMVQIRSCPIVHQLVHSDDTQ